MGGISISTPLFVQSAEDLISRLARVDSEPARAMRAEVQELLTLFRGWEHHKPPDEIRVTKIRQLFDLQRRAMDLLTKAQPAGK